METRPRDTLDVLTEDFATVSKRGLSAFDH